MRLFKSVFFLLLVLFSPIWSSDLRSIDKYAQSDVTDWIFNQASRAVKYVEKNRIYLDPSRVDLSDQGIFLINNEDEMIPLTSIFSSEKGIYIKEKTFNIFGAWKCENCGWLNSRFVNACQKCYTPRPDEQ